MKSYPVERLPIKPLVIVIIICLHGCGWQKTEKVHKCSQTRKLINRGFQPELYKKNSGNSYAVPGSLLVGTREIAAGAGKCRAKTEVVETTFPLWEFFFSNAIVRLPHP